MPESLFVVAGAGQFGAGRQIFQFTSLTSALAALCDFRNAFADDDRLAAQSNPVASEPQIAQTAAHIAHQVESVLNKPMRDAFRVEPGDGHAAWAQPQRLQRKSGDELQLLRPERKENREGWIGEQPGLSKVAANQAKLAEVFLKGGVVPKRDGDRFLLRHSVCEFDTGRKLVGSRSFNLNSLSSASLNVARQVRAFDMLAGRDAARQHGGAGRRENSHGKARHWFRHGQDFFRTIQFRNLKRGNDSQCC